MSAMGPGPATRPGLLRSGSAMPSGPAIRSVFRRYAVAWLYLAAVCGTEIVYAVLSPHAGAPARRVASTTVQKLGHDPVGSLIASAFFPTSALTAWPLLIAF